MADRLIMHIGTPKSGTTYLQEVLWENRARLSDEGVLLPLSDRDDHNDVVRDLTGRAPRRGSAGWDDFVHNVRTTDGTALISEEMFVNVETDARRRISESLTDIPTEIVITARDPIRQVPSVWQQSLKHRRSWSLSHFVHRVSAGEHVTWNRQQDVGGLIDRWSEVVPPERMHVVTVPPSGSAPGALWDRFASVLDIDAAGFLAPRHHLNTTLDAVQAEILRRVNALLDQHPGRSTHLDPVVRYMLVPALIEHHGGHPVVFPDEYRGWAEEYASETSRRIKDSGVNLVGELEDLLGDVSSSASTPSVGDDEMLDAALTALAETCVVSARRRRRLHRTRRRLKESERRRTELARTDLRQRLTAIARRLRR